MADINYTPIRYVLGDEEDAALNLVGVTAREGPQCFLSWDEVGEDVDGFRIVRRKYHYPVDVLDGDLVLSTVGPPDEAYFADTRVIHEELYYYRAFLHRDGEWYVPDNGEVAVFSGTKLEFEGAYDTAVLGQSSQVVSVTLPAETCFRRGDRVLTVANDFEDGDWVRLGTEERGLVAKVFSATASALTLEYKRDEWLLPERDFEELRDVSLTFTRTNSSYSNRSTIARATGSFIEDGIEIGMPLLLAGVQNQPSVLVYPTSVYQGVLVFAADALRDEGPVTTPIISLPSAFIGGDVVTKLQPQGSFLARRIYEDFLPPNFAAEDEALGQSAVLTETVDSDGQAVCLGSPGVRFGLERFIMALAAEFAKEHAAGNYLPTYRDLVRAPLEYVRFFGERYGLPLSEKVDDSYLIRSFLLAQPGVAKRRGRLDLLKNWVTVITKQHPVVIYGKDRVIRLGETGSGFAWDGQEVVDNVADAPLVTLSSGALPEWLVGWTVATTTNPSVRYEVVIIDNGVMFGADLNGDIAMPDDIITGEGLVGGETLQFYAPSGAGPSGPNSNMHSFYDASVTDGVGSFFSDRGMAMYLPSTTTDDENDLLRWALEDQTPETVSLLLYAALTLTVDLS